MPRHFIPLILFLVFPGMHQPIAAQFHNRFYSDVGMNNVSEGVFVTFAGLTTVHFGKYTVGGGLQFSVTGNQHAIVSGYRAEASRALQAGSLPLDVTAFVLVAPFSDILRETNRGVTFSTQRRQFFVCLGTNFRTYAYNDKAKQTYGISQHTRLHEKWNLMYTIRYSLKPPDNPWNVALGITSADYFMIGHETSPMLHLQGTYSSGQRFRFFMDAMYQQAGMFNISVHYFGFFIRPGIIWQLD